MKRREDVYSYYYDWVRRTQPCIVDDDCLGPVAAHHVKTVGSGGVDARNLVAMCLKHHNQVHTVGRRTFARTYNLDLSSAAEELYRRYVG